MPPPGQLTVVDAARLRELEESDLRNVQAVIERASDHHEFVYGHPPGPAEASSCFALLREGLDSYARKLFLGLIESDELVGFTDLVCDWPAAGIWTVGLLSLVPQAPSHGLGCAVVRDVECRAREAGASNLRIAVSTRNEQAQRFWRTLEYRPAAQPQGSPLLVKTLAG